MKKVINEEEGKWSKKGGREGLSLGESH